MHLAHTNHQRGLLVGYFWQDGMQSSDASNTTTTKNFLKNRNMLKWTLLPLAWIYLMKSRKGQQGKTTKTLRVHLFCNLLHLLATVIKFRPRQFSVKWMSEGKEKKKRKKAALKVSSVRRLISFLWYNTAPTHSPHATSKLPCYLS